MIHYSLYYQPTLRLLKFYHSSSLLYYTSGRIGRYDSEIILYHENGTPLLKLIDQSPIFYIVHPKYKDKLLLCHQTLFIYLKKQIYATYQQDKQAFTLYHPLKFIGQLSLKGNNLYDLTLEEKYISPDNLLFITLLVHYLRIIQNEDHDNLFEKNISYINPQAL